jgi:hypothetical protein
MKSCDSITEELLCIKLPSSKSFACSLLVRKEEKEGKAIGTPNIEDDEST